MRYLLLLLLLVPLAVADDGHTFHSINISDPSLSAQSSTWSDHPRSPLVLHGHGTIHFVDDHWDNEIPNPARPGAFLVGVYNRTESTVSWSGQLRLIPSQPDAILVANATSLSYRKSGSLEATAIERDVLDRSHATSAFVGAGPDTYELTQSNAVRLTAKEGELHATGIMAIHLWGFAVETKDQHYQTGYEERQDSLPSQHYTYAWVYADDANATWLTTEPRIYATHFNVLQGLLHPDQGPTLTASELVSDGDTFVALATLVVPTGTLSAWWLLACLALPPTYALVPGPRRARWYARRAIQAERKQHHRLASWWSGRAAKLDAHDPEYRIDHAIRLRNAGKPRIALLEHAIGHDLAYGTSQSDLIAHNAYEATMASLDDHDLEQALEWLTLAFQADDNLVDRARMDPRLRCLRKHPDYPQLVGA